MTSSLSAFNLVLVGDNFPTASMSARDFTFRGRSFAEKLRVGPVFQASSRNVEIQALPERFQVAAGSPDDLDILCEGVSEVVGTFLEFVGRRTIRAVGHNATVQIDVGLYKSIVDALVNKGEVDALLGTGTPLVPSNLVFHSKVGREDQMRVTFAADATPGATGGVIDFNFHFETRRSEDAQAVDIAVEQLRDSLGHAEQILASVRERFKQEATR